MRNDEWKIEQIRLTINNVVRDGVRVTVGDQVIEAVELDMADQWDFMEVAGSQIENRAWVNTALLASAIVSINAVPQPVGTKSKDQIRQILRKIGSSGLDALNAAFNQGQEAISNDADNERISTGN